MDALVFKKHDLQHFGNGCESWAEPFKELGEE